MLSVSLFVWTTIAICVIISGMMGYGIRNENGCSVVIGCSIFLAAISVGLCFVMFFSFNVCLQSKLCEETTDKTVWSFAFPVLAVPFYWFVMLTIKTFSSHGPKVDEKL